MTGEMKSQARMLIGKQGTSNGKFIKRFMAGRRSLTTRGKEWSGNFIAKILTKISRKLWKPKIKRKWKSSRNFASISMLLGLSVTNHHRVNKMLLLKLSSTCTCSTWCCTQWTCLTAGLYSSSPQWSLSLREINGLKKERPRSTLFMLSLKRSVLICSWQFSSFLLEIPWEYLSTCVYQSGHLFMCVTCLRGHSKLIQMLLAYQL